MERGGRRLRVSRGVGGSPVGAGSCAIWVGGRLDWSRDLARLVESAGEAERAGDLFGCERRRWEGNDILGRQNLGFETDGGGRGLGGGGRRAGERENGIRNRRGRRRLGYPPRADEVGFVVSRFPLVSASWARDFFDAARVARPRRTDPRGSKSERFCSSGVWTQ